MGVVAKFVVVEHTSRKSYSEGQVANTVKLQAVMPSDEDDRVTREENQRFWEATPNGTIEMNIQNAHAAEQLQAGNEFYVTFEKVA